MKWGYFQLYIFTFIDIDVVMGLLHFGHGKNRWTDWLFGSIIEYIRFP